MSKGKRWTPESLTARGWRDPDLRADTEEFKRMVKLNNRLLTKQAQDAPAAPSQPRPYERDILRAVLAALQAHPRVAWAQRVNSGMAMLPGRGGKPQPVRFGFEGAPDIIGQMSQVPYLRVEGQPAYGVGAFLAVEVKRPGKKATMAQAAFLLRVREAGGVGFVATGIESIWEHLGKP